MDLKEIDEIEAEANAATPGPWYTVEDTEKYLEIRQRLTKSMEYKIACLIAEEDDAAFIAHSRTNVPNLFRTLRKYMKAYKNLAGYVAKIDPKVKKEDAVFQDIYSAEIANRFLAEAEND